MEKFTKITVGFITQSYERNAAGKFVCTGQEFIAGDQVDYEDVNGNKITPPEHDYQPFEMKLPDKTKTSANKPKRAKLGFLESQLLEACKTVTSYVSDFLYKLDDRVNISEVEEIQQAINVIGKYENKAAWSGELSIKSFIFEQCPDVPFKNLHVNFTVESGKLWIQPTGYSDKTSGDGYGWPIGLEIWQGRLRLIVFDDINSEDPKIIDLEKAKETARSKCNWCNKEIDGDVVKWKELLFCSESCLDACRAAQ